ncbi:unnamed protein product [Allacma fusca]|uniref:Peptidase M12A domain-containing protein n=1 Tax=Allacma fusca TaxID=39272 RepID=A0A8J2P977_9HEXA|nr:unnamed protein product [Allacma fusca]
MMKLAFLAVFIALSQGLPTGRDMDIDTRSRQDKDLFLNDMRFPEGFAPQSGIIGDRYRWPNREVVYEIDGRFNNDERNVILQGMNEISSRTCIRFRQRNGDGNFVFLERGGPGSGCWSYVGQQGGRQVLNLQAPEPGQGHCVWSGTVAHELIHAIGYYHEQSRPDRDDFVAINWSNIPGDVAYNFDKFNWGEENSVLEQIRWEMFQGEKFIGAKWKN